MDIPDVITCWMSHGQMMTKAVASKSTERITSLVARQRNRSRPSKKSPQQRSRDKNEPQKPTPQTNSSEYRILRGQIQGLLFAYKNGLKVSQFLEAFALRYGQYINLFHYGFSSIYELLESMNDIITIQPLASGDDFIVQSKFGPSDASFEGFCVLIHFILTVGNVKTNE